MAATVTRAIVRSLPSAVVSRQRGFRLNKSHRSEPLEAGEEQVLLGSEIFVNGSLPYARTNRDVGHRRILKPGF